MKIRKSVKYVVVAISIIFIIVSCYNIGNVITKTNTINTNREIYHYTNKFNYNYVVNLIENQFIPTTTFEMSQEAYVTDLIDNVNMNLNYIYESSNDSTINYNYQIVGKLSAVYTKDGIEYKIWEKEDILKPLVADAKVANAININENIILDLKPHNALVREFEDQLEMSVTANYTVMLKVNTNTIVEEVEVQNEYIPLITVDLGKKVTTISGENNLEKTEYISKEYSEREKISIPSLIINIVIFVVSISLLGMVGKRPSSNIVRNEYRQELNRILRLCQDKIVQVSQNPNLDKENIIDVTDFGEIIKVSEELFKPILYWYIDEEEEAQFSVISNNVVYRYILRK